MVQCIDSPFRLWNLAFHSKIPVTSIFFGVSQLQRCPRHSRHFCLEIMILFFSLSLLEMQFIARVKNIDRSLVWIKLNGYCLKLQKWVFDPKCDGSTASVYGRYDSKIIPLGWTTTNEENVSLYPMILKEQLAVALSFIRIRVL